MKHLAASIAFVLIHSLLYAQAGFSINDTGDFFKDGKKIGRVVKTANTNWLIPTMAEFTVYDVNDVPRFLFEGNEGKFIFLDDKKSFLPKMVDAYRKQVAEFFASDSILTPRGYNTAYRSQFIKKYKGFNFSEKAERDFNAPVRYVENNIMQGDALIGRYEYRVMENKKDVHVAIVDLNNKKVAYIKTDNFVEGNLTGQVDMTILDENEKVIRVFRKEFDTGLLYKTGISWIVQSGFLGSNGEVTTKKTEKPAEVVKEPTQPVLRDPQPERTEELRQAATQNDAEAQFKLFKNVFVPDQERLMWLKKAAENGHAESQYELAELYYNGPDFPFSKIKGVAQNFEEAFNLYRKSAEQGFAEAQWELGTFYQVGRGVVKEDCEESLKWLLKAANQGDDVWRQFQMAEMYEKGYMYEHCVKKSREEAIIWYKKVVNNKNRTNSAKVELARKKLEKWKVNYKE